eukprot:g16808.t1
MSEAIWRTPCRPRTRGPLGRVHPRDAESPQEVSALKEEHARRMSELQRKHAEEQALASAQQTEALQSCQLHAETAEAQVAQLSRQQQSLQSSGESCRERALQAEKELKEANLEIQELRKQLKVLEESSEIAKGNRIIQSLHQSSKESKVKLRQKQSELTDLEKARLELEKEGQLSKLVLDEKDQELLRGKHREEKMKEDIDEMKRTIDECDWCSEAHDVIKSNQEVIEYLNRQLTERELRTMPTVPMSGTANSTFQSDVPSRSGTTSVALAELLSKVESLAPKSKGLPSSPGYGGHVWTSKIQSSEGPLVAARGLSTPHPSMMDELQLTEVAYGRFIHFWDDLDRLEDAVSSLRQLSARAALLQPAAADAGPAGPAEPTAGAGAAEPSELQRRVWQAEGELQELILGHEETIDARRTLQSLEQSVAELQASVVAKKDLLEETRERSQKGQRYIQALQQQQLQLVSQAGLQRVA